MSSYRLYDISLLSFLIVFGHFTSEILVFRTAAINGPAMSPLIVGSECSSYTAVYREADSYARIATSLVWMIVQYDYYVKV